MNSEKNALAHQNRAIREFLKTQSLDAQIDALAIDNSSASDETSNDLSDLMSAPLDIRYDSELGHERVCLDLPDWTSSETSGSDQTTSRFTRGEPVKGDSMAALDFILALEWPCKDHVKHHAINPDATLPKACDVGEFHGHALTATAAVLQSSLPSSGTDGEQAESQRWVIPHSEIDK